MENNTENGKITFDLPKNQSNVIKVIGIGGGGSNAINHMFKQGIKGVDFIVCNTDAQALDNSPVPNKIQLGVHLTEGLGAGANPEIGQQSAIESIPEIEKMLDTNTKMIFITAGMGGGTGTGAAPIIAQLAKERDILTIAIVTIPFQYEGKVRSEQALLGVEKLRKQVDSLIVINNNKLREVYGNLGFKAGYSKADEVLSTASRGIAEVITHHYTQNIDLRDAKTVLANSGTAIMGSATAEGENRAKEAITAALDSPLLNDNKITGAKNVLLLIVSGSHEITIDEISEINEHIQAEAGHNANIIMGVGEEEGLGEKIAVTIIATGFCIEQQAEIVNTEPKKIIHALEDDQKIVENFTQKLDAQTFNFDSNITEKTILDTTEDVTTENLINFNIAPDIFEVNTPTYTMDLVPTSEWIKNLDVVFEIVSTNTINNNDFYFTSPETKEINVVEPEFVVKDQAVFTFDFPLTNTTETNTQEKLVFDLTPEINQIQVNNAVELVPITENSKDGVVKYTLEDYMEVENKLTESKKEETPAIETIPEELNLTLSQTSVESIPQYPTNSSVDTNLPLEMTIEEASILRAEERKRKMKEYNYKFNNATRIDELEKVPAYKRMGVDISTQYQDNSRSRLSLGTDNNDEIQLRSNNSYLHDNVD